MPKMPNHDLILTVVNDVDVQMMQVQALNNKMTGNRERELCFKHVFIWSAATDDQQQDENKGSARPQRRRYNRR